MKIKPLSDQVFIQRVYLTEQKTASGIIIVQEDEDQQVRDTIFGRVIAVGPGKQVDGTGPINHGINVGDIVVYVDNQGIKFKYLTDYLDVMPASMIRAVVEGVEVTDNDNSTQYGKVSNIQELG